MRCDDVAIIALTNCLIVELPNCFFLCFIETKKKTHSHSFAVLQSEHDW